MKIQSLSVVVPTKKCINNCAFCVSKMHYEDYPDITPQFIMEDGRPNYEAKHYIKRVEFARDNGCNTAILTGTGEPQQNFKFLRFFGHLNFLSLDKPFRRVEMQTTGAGITKEDLEFFYNEVGVTTMSISVSALDNDVNAQYNGTHPKIKVDIANLCRQIKEVGMNVRLSLNLTDWFDRYQGNAEYFFNFCHDTFGADQITLRALYADDKQSPQAQWIDLHSADRETVYSLKQYITFHGKMLEKMEFGYTKYSVSDMGIVLDDDCMSTEPKDSYKYLILRPNCRLYSKWDDKGSLIF